MNIYVGGGRNPDLGEIALHNQRTCVSKICKKLGTREILHIPFARTGIRKKNRDAFGPTVFQLFVESLGIIYKNASYSEDIENFTGDTIYINGGNDCDFLLEMCLTPILHKTIFETKNLIGESCGAMILGQTFFSDKQQQRIGGLYCIQDTLILTHYMQGNSSNIIPKNNNIKHILGIEEMTFVNYNNGIYGDIIGYGKAFYDGYNL